MRYGWCLGLACLGCVGCGSVQRGSQQQLADRERESVRYQLHTVQVPENRVVLRLPVSEGLKPLPQGAVYREQHGRASVEARVVRDTLYIEAHCDSLQQLVWEYERQLAHDSLREARVEKQRESAPLRPLCIGLLVLACIVCWKHR